MLTVTDGAVERVFSGKTGGGAVRHLAIDLHWRHQCRHMSSIGSGVCYHCLMVENTERDVSEVVLVAGLCAEELDERLRRTWRLGDVSRRGAAFYLADMHDRGLHQALGRPTAVSYAVRELGIARRTARELIEVGLRLRELPVIDAAFAEGRVTWSQVRRLCAVATAENEGQWLDRALGITQDEMDRLVRRTRRGDAPPAEGSGLPQPRFAVRLELDALQWAVFEQARAKLRAELAPSGDGPIPDEELILEMARMVLLSDADGTVPGRRAVDGGMFKVVVREGDAPVIVGEDGVEPLDPAVAEPALSDGATPPKLRAKVFARDDHRCQNCGSGRSLQAHHVQFRSDGGSTALENLVTTCSTCHGLVHHGLLSVDVATGDDGAIAFVFSDGDGRRLGRRVLDGPRVRVAPGVAPCATPQPPEVPVPTEALDIKWLARNLDRFETVGGKLVLKARHRNGVLV